MENGHNFWTLNILHRRFSTGARDDSLFGRMQPYLGVGGGAAVPFVRPRVDGVSTNEYQLAGPAAQGFLGLNVDLLGPLSFFGEYKITYAHIDADLKRGGTITTETLTTQLIFGVSLTARP